MPTEGEGGEPHGRHSVEKGGGGGARKPSILLQGNVEGEGGGDVASATDFVANNSLGRVGRIGKPL